MRDGSPCRLRRRTQGLFVLPLFNGGQTVRLWQTFDGGLAEGQIATFMIEGVAGGFSEGQLIVPVPEPGTGMLVGLGLVAVAVRRRLG